MQPSLAMLMKTNVEKMAFCRLLAMLMKTIYLKSLSRDVDEKKESWLKPEVENGEGGVRQGPSWFCPFGRFNYPVESQASITRRCAAAGRGTGNNPPAWRCGPKCGNSSAELKLSATTHLADPQRGIWLR